MQSKEETVAMKIPAIKIPAQILVNKRELWTPQLNLRADHRWLPCREKAIEGKERENYRSTTIIALRL